MTLFVPRKSFKKMINLNMSSLLVVLLVLIGITTINIAHPKAVSATTRPPKVALIYGDSLTWESMWSMHQQFALKTGWTHYIHAYPNTSPCVWDTWLNDDIASYHPTVITIITDGNTYGPTNLCMVDSDGSPLVMGTDAYYARFQTDLDTFFATATASGAKVVFVKAAPFLDPVRDAAVTKLATIAQTLAANYHGVSISNAVRSALSKNGKYTAYKPCLITETIDQGCNSGIIPIRTITGIQTGLHLCPGGLPDAYPWFCPTYSSGEFRFGKAVTSTSVSPPKPILP